MTFREKRRETMKKMVVGTAMVGLPSLLFGRFQKADILMGKELAGKINHSACKWCYGDIPLDVLCQEGKKFGLQSIDLLGPKAWPVVQEQGLTCAMGNGAEMGLTRGWNNPMFHEKLIQNYTNIIPVAKKYNIPSIICFSGNREGMDDETGLKNAADGLKKIMSLAEEHKVNIVMELLNSKVDHIDYQCDYSEWGVALCEAVGSDRFKLLYDIYHMQIMEGDVIRTINENHQYFAHYHTGGVPGRHEIDDTQELYYPAIMKAIVETGFTGYVAQEFIPTWDNKLDALKDAIEICSL
jgi:hydroxypyruvate isomerase